MIVSGNQIHEVVQVLKEGKPVVFPTETVYGIGIALSQKKNSGVIFDLKGREENKPLSLHIARVTSLDLKKIFFPRIVNFLIHRFWPGPLTLVIKSRDGEKTGYRFPSNLIARQLIEELGEPVLATSANLSGKDPALTIEEAERYFGDKVPLYLDGGKTEFQAASTVLDLSQYPPNFIREGSEARKVRDAIQEFEAFLFMKKKILLVCTGNTCRSPMAEGWLRRYFLDEGLADSFEVISCGTTAFSGVPPSEEAIEVMREEGIDISVKRSRPLNDELLFQSDIIFVMTEAHKDYILERAPEVSGKIHILDIPDPIGMEKEAYRRVFEAMKSKLTKEMAWVLKS